jgi:hypothetical protein
MGEQPEGVDLRYVPIGGGKGKVTARRGGELIHSDNLDPGSAAARWRYAKALCEKAPALKPEEVEAELLRLADTGSAATPSAGSSATESVPEDAAAALLKGMPQDIRDEADAMLTDPMLTKQVIDDVAALDVAGERELIATVFLIGVSRLLPRPLAGIVQGPSSSGKSYLIEKTAALFPPEAVIQATQMTPQALFHMRPGTLAHRFIVGGERSRVEDDERAEATRALREMLSAGKLTKLMPVKVDGGRVETVHIEQDGPIAFVESTTLTKVFDEDANRCLMLHTDEQPEQTRRVVRKLAAAYRGVTGEAVSERIVQRHHALQRMLGRPPVVIPYAERLGELLVSDRVEVRRAFPQLMSMVQALALLHQRQRQKDANGHLVASPDDYQLARHLLAAPMSRLLGGRVSAPARRFYDRLVKWATGEFTTSEAKNRETSSKSAVYGWVAELHDAGLVEMVEAPRGRTPARWKPTGMAPDDGGRGGLPTVEDVFPESAWKHGLNAEPATRA